MGVRGWTKRSRVTFVFRISRIRPQAARNARVGSVLRTRQQKQIQSSSLHVIVVPRTVSVSLVDSRMLTTPRELPSQNPPRPPPTFTSHTAQTSGDRGTGRTGLNHSAQNYHQVPEVSTPECSGFVCREYGGPSARIVTRA